MSLLAPLHYTPLRPFHLAVRIAASLTLGLATLTACSRTESPVEATNQNAATDDQPISTQSAKASHIYRGGKIYTGVDSAPMADFVATHKGQIIAVGDLSEMEQWVGPDTMLHSLKGAALYPGFTDAHAHLLGIGMRELTLNLEGTASIAQLQQTVQQALADLPSGEPLYGRGWIETGWPEGRFPSRQDLDLISPDNPVILDRADGHASVVNSHALKLAGITRETPDPDGGKILHDADGNPTGMLIDNARGLVSALLEAPSADKKRQAYQTGANVYAAYGWTGLHNMSVNPADVPMMHALSTPSTKDNRRALGIRVYNSLHQAGLNDLIAQNASQTQSGRIITRAIKLYVDGALGSRGAALFEPYTDRPDTRGLLLLQKQDALAIFKKALDNNIQVNTHAIGDRGNRLVLDWYKQAYAEAGLPPSDIAAPRFRIEHAQIVRPEDIADFKSTGIIASMQPSHAIGDLHFAPDRLGTERLNGAYAWRSMIDAGVAIAAGSDAPVERGDPRIEFYAAIARRDLNGFQTAEWHPEEAVSRSEALKMLTLWPAYASFQEDELGTIEVGKRADFTVFDQDIMTIPAADILGVETVMTIVDGEIIYQRSDD